MTSPLTDQQVDAYAEQAIHADHDGTRMPPDFVTALVDEVRRLQQSNRFLLRQVAKKDRNSGAADRALDAFLRGDSPAAGTGV